MPDLLTVLSIFLDIFAIIGLLGFIFGVAAGLVRPVVRFGWAAWKKQVYIVSEVETGNTIRGDLERSGIVKKKNIVCKNSNQLGEIHNARLIILEYSCLGKETVLDVVKRKNANCGAIIYANFNEIDRKTMDELNKVHHVSVVNFRGRLVNEVLVLLMSCSFSREDAKNQ